MSKAFTREDDSGSQEVVRPLLRPALPPGAKNYVTRDGAERFLAEQQERLRRRAELMGDSPSASTEEELARVEARLAQLDFILGSMVVVDPPASKDKVRFGAFVTIRENAAEMTYRIVGVDEIDLDRGWISWQSPLAKALINKGKGDKITFTASPTRREFEIIAVEYNPESAG